MSASISQSESQRYDRQIRVWGAEAQARIQRSKVLICGLKKLNVEVLKNIVLAGMNVTIQDSSVVSMEDLQYNFFVGQDDLGRNMSEAALRPVQELNPYAHIAQDSRPIESLDDSFFQEFNVILMSKCSQSQAVRVNKIGRLKNPHSIFFWSDVFGEDAIFYSDFGENFQYKEDAPTNNNNNNSVDSATITNEIKSVSYPDLESVLARGWGEIRSRFFPLSSVYVKDRLINCFRESHGRDPDRGDEESMRQLLQQLVDGGGHIGPLLSPESSSLRTDKGTMIEVGRLCEVARAVSITTCSVLGSFLSQEVIKSVSMSGCPASNVFVFSGDDFVAKAIPIAMTQS